jgi:hypothetical protein
MQHRFVSLRPSSSVHGYINKRGIGMSNTTKPRSVAPGIINLGGNDIECHVLSDGRRVLETTQVQGLLGAAKDRHLSRQIERIGAELQANSVRPSLEPIEFIRPTGGTANGYEARAILAVCRAYQNGFIHNTLHPKQIPNAIKASEIVGACSEVGIVALIDEATGYETIRKSGELADIYRRFFLEKASMWELVFTAEISDAMCKLYRKPVERNPRWQAGVNGRIYDLVFGKTLMAELRRRNPKIDGRTDREWNHHQLLQEAVKAGFKHKLEVVLLLARTSSYVPQFWDRMRATFQGVPLQLELPEGA